MPLDSARSVYPMLSGRVPMLGHMPRLHLDALGVLRRAHQELGPVFRLDYGFGLKPIFVLGQEAFSMLRNDRTNSSANLDMARLIIDNSLLPNDGPDHKRVRGALNGPFSPRGLKAASVGPLIDELLAPRLESWRDRSSLVIATEVREFAIDVIFRLVGIEQGDLPAWRVKFHQFLLGLVHCPEFPGSPPWLSKRACAWMNERFQALITRARQHEDRETLLGAMVHSVDEDGQGLTDEELLGNLRLLGVAGHETTASVLSWVMIVLADQPKLWDRVCEEANAADGPPLDPREISQFPVAEAMFRETLRMYPPAWFLYRRTTEDIEFQGVPLPKDTVLVIPVIALSRDRDIYEDTDEHNIDRWLGRDRSPRPIEMCQFGGGPHFCLGYRLALLEGIQFIVSTARALTRHGKRPVLRSRFPRPRYLPLMHAPFSYKVHLERA